MSSDAAELDTDLTIVLADADGGDGGVPEGGALRRFALAALDASGPDDPDLTDARDGLTAALGRAAMVNAAGVVATFDAITRVADATGTQLDEIQVQMAGGLLGDLDLSHLRSD